MSYLVLSVEQMTDQNPPHFLPRLVPHLYDQPRPHAQNQNSRGQHVRWSGRIHVIGNDVPPTSSSPITSQSLQADNVNHIMNDRTPLLDGVQLSVSSSIGSTHESPQRFPSPANDEVIRRSVLAMGQQASSSEFLALVQNQHSQYSRLACEQSTLAREWRQWMQTRDEAREGNTREWRQWMQTRDEAREGNTREWMQWMQTRDEAREGNTRERDEAREGDMREWRRWLTTFLLVTGSLGILLLVAIFVVLFSR